MNSLAISTVRFAFTLAVALPVAACSGSLESEPVEETVEAAQTDPVGFCLADTTRNPIIGNSANNTLTGTSGDDCIVGLGGSDTINAGGGNDIVFGGDGDDIVNGGDGNDLIQGGPGQDTLTGNAGDDNLDGGDGDDRLFGSAGADRLLGGAGQDQLNGESGNDHLYGATGEDTLAGGDGDDFLSDCANRNQIDGGPGGDDCAAVAAESNLTSCAVLRPCGRLTIFDQVFTEPNNLHLVVNGRFRFVGQTYTAGFTGTLVGVSVDVRTDRTRPLRVTIRGVTGLLPNSTILAQTTLTRSSSSLSQVITFSTPIAQVNGDRYAIVVDYPTAPPQSDEAFWDGAVFNAYPTGGVVKSNDGITWESEEESDLHFRTRVTPN